MTRPVYAKIYLDRLKKNYLQLKKLVGDDVEIFPVVKADAYGHNAVMCSQALLELGVKTLCVACLEEALELIENGINARFLLLSGFFPAEEQAVVRFGLIPAISDIETAHHLNKEALRQKRKTKIHLKVDTGMGRLGVLLEDAPAVIEEIMRMEGLELEGILSHLSWADSIEPSAKEYTEKQIEDFQLLVQAVKKKYPRVKFFHLAGSAGLIRYPSARFNATRPGIYLYGSDPFYPQKVNMPAPEPVMSLTSEIVLIKELPAGSKISYGAKTQLKKKTRVGIVPIGYADGLPRSLKPGFEFLTEGNPTPLLGVVTMDLIILDLSKAPLAKPKSKVLIFGREKEDKLPVEKLAHSAQTISYEILVRIGKRVKKQYL